MAFSHAVGRTTCRPRRGPGPGFYFLTMADLGPVIASRSSGIDGCTLLSADQNGRSGQNPSTRHSLLSPALPFVCRTTATERRPGQRWEKDDDATAGLLTGVWTCRRRMAPRRGPTRVRPHGAASVVGLLPAAAMVSRAPAVGAILEHAVAQDLPATASSGI
jgi:hypothetical protein